MEIDATIKTATHGIPEIMPNMIRKAWQIYSIVWKFSLRGDGDAHYEIVMMVHNHMVIAVSAYNKKDFCTHCSVAVL